MQRDRAQLPDYSCTYLNQTDKGVADLDHLTPNFDHVHLLRLPQCALAEAHRVESSRVESSRVEASRGEASGTALHCTAAPQPLRTGHRLLRCEGLQSRVRCTHTNWIEKPITSRKAAVCFACFHARVAEYPPACPTAELQASATAPNRRETVLRAECVTCSAAYVAMQLRWTA
jgi:hypothetical protein